MKTLALTFTAFFAFTAMATAQQVQERLDQQPPPVTQQQVEKDAKVALELRKKEEATKKEQERLAEAKRKEDDKKALEKQNIAKATKTSTTPGKQ